MENNIKGKVIVITGASSGLGQTAAMHLAALLLKLQESSAHDSPY